MNQPSASFFLFFAVSITAFTRTSTWSCGIGVEPFQARYGTREASASNYRGVDCGAGKSANQTTKKKGRPIFGTALCVAQLGGIK